jgi:Spy/CpxP family protein refolding chaperone
MRRRDSVTSGVRAAVIGSVFVAAVSVGRATPVSAQDQQRPQPRAVLGEVLKAVDLSAEQKTAIKVIVESHRDAVQAARHAGDTMTVRQEMREALQTIVQVLTPEQRDQAKTAFRAFAERQSR